MSIQYGDGTQHWVVFIFYGMDPVWVCQGSLADKKPISGRVECAFRAWRMGAKSGLRLDAEGNALEPVVASPGGAG